MVRLLGCVAFLFVTATTHAGETPPRGIVLVAAGVGRIDPIAISAKVALPLAGAECDVEEFVWTYSTGRILRDLQDTQHIHKQARLLADKVLRLKVDCPERCIYLMGHSGGGGLVLLATSLLPPDTLERVILLSAAISPHYDLRPALKATRREIVSFHSTLDRVVLDWGTSQFGTIDRVYTASAGCIGFEIPTDLDEEDARLYARLVQIGWKPEMLLANHGGLHGSACMPGFLAHHVAPWLKP